MTPERFVHYKVCIKELDDEHWGLISDLDKIISSLLESGTGTGIGICEVMIAYDKFILGLCNHYDREESLMNLNLYKFIIPHIDSHNLLKSQAEIIKKSMIIDNVFSPVAYKYRLNELEQLMIDHIDHFDIMLNNFLKSNNKSELSL